MPLTISQISFLTIIANSLKMTLTNIYFFSKWSKAIDFFLLLHTLPLPLGGSRGTSALVGVVVGSAWAVGVVQEGGVSLEGSITERNQIYALANYHNNDTTNPVTRTHTSDTTTTIGQSSNKNNNKVTNKHQEVKRETTEDK